MEDRRSETVPMDVDPQVMIDKVAKKRKRRYSDRDDTKKLRETPVEDLFSGNYVVDDVQEVGIISTPAEVLDGLAFLTGGLFQSEQLGSVFAKKRKRRYSDRDDDTKRFKDLPDRALRSQR